MIKLIAQFPSLKANQKLQNCPRPFYSSHVVIHVPYHVKKIQHTHTITKHIHHGGGGGGDSYEVLGYTYGHPISLGGHDGGGDGGHDFGGGGGGHDFGGGGGGGHLELSHGGGGGGFGGGDWGGH